MKIWQHTLSTGSSRGVRSLLIATMLFGLLAPFAATAAMVNLAAVINGAQADTNSPATATAAMTFDDATNLFNWNINYSVNDLKGTVTVAHFHGPATMGQNAGVQVPIDNPAVVPVLGSATITNEQKGQLLDSLWYINIHTTEYGSGEIRGQVEVQVAVVPLPAAFWLLGGGLAGLAAIRRRVKK